MDEYLKNFKNKRKNITPSKKINLKPFITRFLLGIIFVLISIIFTNMSDNNLFLYKEYVFTESLPFTKIKSWYENLFGSVLPSSNDTQVVFSENFTYESIEEYLDGEVLTVEDNSIINNIESGIVVFIGEKEGYGNTVIIQGVDGADIWYGNLTNISVNLYDYLEEETVIGSTIDNKLYLVIKKDDTYIKYEDYQV